MRKRFELFYSSCARSLLFNLGHHTISKSTLSRVRAWQMRKLGQLLCMRRQPNETHVRFARKRRRLVQHVFVSSRSKSLTYLLLQQHYIWHGHLMRTIEHDPESFIAIVMKNTNNTYTNYAEQMRAHDVVGLPYET